MISAPATRAVVFDAYGTLFDVAAVRHACAGVAAEPERFGDVGVSCGVFAQSMHEGNASTRFGNIPDVTTKLLAVFGLEEKILR